MIVELLIGFMYLNIIWWLIDVFNNKYKGTKIEFEKDCKDWKVFVISLIFVGLIFSQYSIWKSWYKLVYLGKKVFIKN
jgi:hypothetical protein